MLSCGVVVDVQFLFRRLKVLTIATSLSSPLLALMFSLFPGNCKSLEVFDCSLSRLNSLGRGGARSNNFFLWGGAKALSSRHFRQKNDYLKGCHH